MVKLIKPNSVYVTMVTTTATPVPDKKTDRYGNPTRWILKLSNGKIAFPQGFTVDPREYQYLVDVVVEKPNYAIVKLHQHHYVIEKDNEEIIVKCQLCGNILIRSDSADIIISELHDRGLNIPVPTWVLEKYHNERRQSEINADLRELLKPIKPLISELIKIKNEEEEIKEPEVIRKKTGYYICEHWESCTEDRDESWGSADCSYTTRSKEPKGDHCWEEVETITIPKDPAVVRAQLETKEKEYENAIKQLTAMVDILRDSLRGYGYIEMFNKVLDAFIFNITVKCCTRLRNGAAGNPS